MKYALIDGKKSEPNPRKKGICSFCGSQVIAKCGKYKIWHWAHKSTKDCDSWWEIETDWHRNWKNHFPIEYQEVIHIDEKTGERHIADVKTQNNMVIEFQNSNIHLNEIASRESFYKKMIWIINGNRSDTLDHANFNISLNTGYTIESKNPLIIKLTWYSTSKIFEKWSESRMPVFFDFSREEIFWLKSFDKKSKEVIVRIVSKNEIIEKNGGFYENVK